MDSEDRNSVGEHMQTVGHANQSLISEIGSILRGACRRIREAYRFSKRLPEELGQWKVLFEMFFLLATVWISWTALNIYQATNRVASREQLYETEQLIANREIAEPEFYLALNVEVSGIPPEEYIQRALAISILEGDPTKYKHAADLYAYIWGQDDLFSDDKKRLVRLYLHSETYLYHMHNVFDYVQEGILKPKEGDTWLGILQDISPHPMFLTAVWAGHENGYLSREFGEELQDRLARDPDARAVIEIFYPDLLLAGWLDALPDYGY